jgi:cell division topological specificity factor
MTSQEPQNIEQVVEAAAETVPAASAPQSKLIQWWVDLFQKISGPLALQLGMPDATASAKEDAKNRLKLVLMHDRTQLSPTLIENMRDELVQVISKYVEIDQTALDLCLEQETNTIALVANISVVRAREAGILEADAEVEATAG